MAIKTAPLQSNKSENRSATKLKDDSDPTIVFLWSPWVGIFQEPAKRDNQLLCKRDFLLW